MDKKTIDTQFTNKQQKRRNFLLLYIDTGSGHKTPAIIMQKELKSLIKSKNKSDNVLLLNGFGPKQKIAHVFFEKGYNYTCSYFNSLYSLFYDITCNKFILHLVELACNFKTTKYLKKIIEKNNITDIVSFHFCVTPAACKAVRQIYINNKKNDKNYQKIQVTQVITDPYSFHPAWFLPKNNAKYAVFSDYIKNTIVKKNLLPKNTQIRTFPFLINNKFSNTNELLSDSNKTVLFCGNGTKISIIQKITKKIIDFSLNNSDFAKINFIIICGKSQKNYNKIKKIINKSKVKNIELHTYVKNMPELIKKSNCVLTKAGASMIHQILICQKPLIIYTYIHGQELGNLKYIINNKYGYFIQDQTKICLQILKIIYHQCSLNKNNLIVNNQLLAEYIYNLN